LVDISGFPEVAQVGIVILALILIFVSAKYISKPIFRIVAQTKIRELFVATALAMVLGISLLMTIVGLSPALGTFVAGVVLADSEYRHELESDIEPFKGLLLGIFFITIGASLDFILISEHLLMIVGITFGLIAVKFVVLYVIGSGFKMERKDRSFFAVALAQGGEFAFVLFTFMNTNGIMDRTATAPYISAVALTMFITPFLFKIYEKIAESKVSDVENEEMDIIEEKGKKVILAGFGRVGTDVGRFLLSAGIKPVILDNDATNVKILRKFGYEVYYGDISRMDLLEAAGAEEAELLIMTMDDIEVSKKLVELIKKHYPNLKIIANSKNLEATYKLMEENIEGVRNETFGTALMLGQDALKILGKDPYDAYRMMRIFRKHNEDMINKLYKRHQEEPENYISEYQRQMANLEEMMILDVELESEDLDKAWTRANPDQ
jgi:CPA2 family monovalent cation:H+ antiporter-2/glutathione-regulated potassium-efflux system ancillary protein KefC